VRDRTEANEKQRNCERENGGEVMTWHIVDEDPMKSTLRLCVCGEAWKWGTMGNKCSVVKRNNEQAMQNVKQCDAMWSSAEPCKVMGNNVMQCRATWSNVESECAVCGSE